jgi:hypothetical protein
MSVERVIVYRDHEASRWAWRAVSASGDTVSEKQAYTDESDAVRAALCMFGEAVVVREETSD